MPASPLNPRQQNFVRLVAQGRSGREAYQKVYRVKDRVADAAAARLLANVKVAAALRELQGQAVKKTLVTVETLTRDAFEIRDLAVKDGQHSAAISALALAARLNGLITDRKEIDIVHHKPARSPVLKDLELSEEEWLRLYAPHLNQ
jgi:phage terminase small subunit